MRLALPSYLPLVYGVRKRCLAWKVWIVPVTVAYAGLPLVLWYEHELLAETVFFAAISWMIAGWCAWVRQPAPDPALASWMVRAEVRYPEVRYQEAAAFFREAGSLATMRFTGWCILVAVALVFLPGTNRTLGVWALALGGYLFGVFLVGGVKLRFSGRIRPVLFLLVPLPTDAVWRAVSLRFRGRVA